MSGLDVTVDLHIDVKTIRPGWCIATCTELPTLEGLGDTEEEAAVDLMEKGRRLLERATGAKSSKLGPLLKSHERPKS
jgi:hypothetical protein